MKKIKLNYRFWASMTCVILLSLSVMIQPIFAAVDERTEIEVSNQEYIWPALKNIARFIGKQYIGYTMSKMFSYLETRLSKRNMDHVYIIWNNYNKLRYQNIASAHYANCPVCQNIGELLRKDDFESRIGIINSKIETSNKVTDYKLRALEQNFISALDEVYNEVKKQGRKIDEHQNRIYNNSSQVNVNKKRIEGNLDLVVGNKTAIDSIASNMQSLAHIIDKIESLASLNENEIDIIEERAKPRVYISNRFFDNNRMLRPWYVNHLMYECRTEFGHSTQNLKKLILYNGEDYYQLAKELAKELNISFIKYEGSGFMGYEEYNLVIFNH